MGTVEPKAFLEHDDLVPGVTMQYDPAWDDGEELVVIDLDDPLQTYGAADDE